MSQSEMPDLKIESVSASRIPLETLAHIHELCDEAYGEDLAHLFAAYSADIHVTACLEGRLVGHAMVVTRWLSVGQDGPMRTAYVEMVATAPDCRNRGIATAVMKRLAKEVAKRGYELAALCPADTQLYGRLGWEYWRGPLYIRQTVKQDGEVYGKVLIPTPEERVMILRLPATPASIDLDEPLSAEWRPGGELW